MRDNLYTKEEDAFLKENYKTMSHREMGIVLNRTPSAVESKCHKLGILKSISPPIQVGEKFGRLTVTGKSEKTSKSRGLYYFCQCDCGNKTESSGNSLRRGNAKSCGCYVSDKTKQTMRLAPGESAYNILEGRSKRGARDRDGIPYELLTQEFRCLIIQNCYWCGSEPKPWSPFHNKDGSRKKNRLAITQEWADLGWVKVNGIDRLDNEIGYVLKNCVPCCFTCNRMKMDLGIRDFLLHIEKILKHQQNLNKFS